ncbi:hypothetical protein C9I92_15170 [Photobacterium ganghwense]|uniref:SMODS and SLOG-associating 2TM effector domain-containing protein n=2 Tax=Photobacterium ganghwense TaxID=320778 RepID=A0A0J1H8J9_9GAMM|nr:hypothetical protein [Photobacterium ganghwense]KLV07986.1 hypothetical protein ABT57_14155 [Photobacterium ganghwense]PSU07093.1 hypothetical protein C9I92_15170 [Photobacterium ganghwense]
MSRHDTQFKIRYSNRLEQMNACFYSRLDSAMSILQIFLGSAVVSSTQFNTVIGLFIALIAAITHTVKPAIKAIHSEYQHKKYVELLTQEPTCDDALLAQYKTIQSQDNAVLQIFDSAAYVRAGIELGCDVSNITLTRLEIVMSFLAGESLSRTNNK